MAAVNFYELRSYFGCVLRSERSLNRLIKWIGQHRCLLEIGCYSVYYADSKLGNVFVDKDGSVHFDDFV